MGWIDFLLVFAVGVMLVVIQGFFAWRDGYLTQAQLQARGIDGWSFMEHGGMWGDVFLVSPIIAYIVTTYSLDYTSNRSMLIFAGFAAFGLACGELWRREGIKKPEAHTHDGSTTVAGWIHIVYFIVAFWIITQFYFNLTHPQVRVFDLTLISTILSLFFYLGAAKLSDAWEFERPLKILVCTEIAIVWLLTAYWTLRFYT